ncbi:universal stress protein [Robiginitalea sp. IMCC44478]|uniref:universal stress protein n=1 Tax=Robiginitalea sp. IMCC44478 TaxID=3459122 RepID=UPI0040421554
MNRILIPTDFSETATNAVEYGLNIFDKQPALFYFLNTYTPDFIHSRVMALAQGSDQDADRAQLESEKGLANLVQDIRMRYPESKHEFSSISSFNLLTEEVREQICLKNIDLLISGTTGASGLRELFLGSNTIRILRTASDIPVLIIPREAKFRKGIRLGLITDYSSSYSDIQLKTLRFFTEQLSAELHIMHIGELSALSGKQHYNRRQLLMEAESLQPCSDWVTFSEGKASTIADYIKELDIGFLMMIRNEHSLISDWVREPVVKRMAFHVEIPFLVMQPSKD